MVEQQAHRDPDWELITRHHVLVANLGVHGNLFGGITMQWIDEAAAIYADMLSPNVHVTGLVEQIKFIRPVKEAETVEVWTRAVGLTNSSVAIEIRVDKVDHVLESITTIATTKVVMVAVDNGVKTRFKLHKKYDYLELIRVT